MSEETTPTTPATSKASIRERLSNRARDLVTREIPDFGPIRIRRISVSEALALSALKEGAGLELAVKSACDESGNPLFGNLDAIKAIDWPLATAIMQACKSVNDVGAMAETGAKN